MVIDAIISYIADISVTILVPYTIAFLVLLMGSFTDIKTREVPDWINFGLIGTGFGINALFSVIYWKIDFILGSVIGFGIFFAIAWVMFYAGQWGGGDSKIMMGIGAIIGVDILSINTIGFYSIFQLPLIAFLINVLLIGAVYGILWSVCMVVKNRKKFSKSFRKINSMKKNIKIKKFILLLFIVLMLFSVIVQNFYFKLICLYTAFVVILTFYIWIAVKAVEKSCMLKYVKPQQLTEGDWIAKDVKVNGKYITGPKDLGISKKQINKLIALYKKRKVTKILIKEGIPFVPSFFVAFVVTLTFGNLLLLMLNM